MPLWLVRVSSARGYHACMPFATWKAALLRASGLRSGALAAVIACGPDPYAESWWPRWFPTVADLQRRIVTPLRDRRVRRGVAFVLLALLLYRLGTYIPLPGMDLGVFFSPLRVCGFFSPLRVHGF